MILIGENLNIMSQTIGPALKERNAEPIRELVKAEAEGGMDYLDINIGPARKAGDELMDWVVREVQQVTDLPLSLDTTNLVAMEAGLKVHKGRALINSVSLQPDRFAPGLALVNKYDADVIGLLWGVDGMPRDANERCSLAVDFIYQANEAGVPNQDIWIDPILTPISVGVNQVKECFDFMSMLGDIAPDCKSVVGLSNISNGTPQHLRKYLNRVCLVMLMDCGLYSAIVDALDPELDKIARGKAPEFVNLIHQVVAGNEPDAGSIDEETAKYIKTVKVLTGESLYSHAWLDI